MTSRQSKILRAQIFVMRKLVVTDLKKPGGETILDDEGFERLYLKAKNYVKTSCF